MLESGNFLVPRQAEWLAAFRQECLAFPNGRYDGQVDSMTQFLSVTGAAWRWILPIATHEPSAGSADSVAAVGFRFEALRCAAKRRGVKVGRPAKLSEFQLEQAREMIGAGKSRADVAALLSVNVATLRRALHG